MRIHPAFALISFGVLAASGCGSNDWLAFGYDSKHFSKQPTESTLTPSAVQASLHVNFDFSIPAGPAGGGSVHMFTASPSVYNNVAYVGGLNGIFYAIYGTGASKGTVKWQYPPAAAGAADACGITTQPLLLATGSGNPSGPGIASSAALVTGVPGHTRAVIFGAPDPTSNGGDGRVWALDADTGQCIWKSAVIAPTSGTAKIGYSSPAIAHGRAYLGVSAKSPDAPITIGQLFAVNLTDGLLDAGFGFSSTNGPAGGGIWSSPAITPSGNVVVTTGNSCHDSNPSCMTEPTINDSLSMLKLDYTNGNVLWQLQPVPFNLDEDPDWASPPTVGQVSCGSLAISVQKDGYVYAADIKTGGPFSNPACSWGSHSLECPRWSFPHVPALPFTGGVHNDTRFIRMGALDGDRFYVIAGGPAVSESVPGHPGSANTNRMYSLDVCAADANRIRWILDVPGFSPGAPSTANGVIYIGSDDGHLYAYADTSVLPAASSVCSYPGLPPDLSCSSAGFQPIGVPAQLKAVAISGSVPGVPAISNGQVYVATTAGHVIGITP
jgi:outer membrane protein assembly factor BamB